MRIVIVVGILGGGGAQRHLVNIGNLLAQEGHELIFLVRRKYINEYDLFHDIKKIYIYRNSNSRINKIFNLLLLKKNQKQQIKKIKPDLVISMIGENRYIPRIREWKYVYFSANTIKARRTEWYNELIYKPLEMKSISRCDTFVVQCNEQKEEYSKKIQQKIIIAENPIDDIFFNQNRGQIHSVYRFVSTGRFDKQKDFKFMIKGFNEVIKKNPKTTLTIFGYGKEKKKLVKQINKYKIGENIFLRPFSQNIQDELINYDCFTMTSKYEGLSNSMLEAMAVGLPCVIVKCPTGVVDTISIPNNGIMVEKRSVSDYAKSIIFMQNNAILANNFSKKGRQFIIENNSFSIYYKKINYVIEINSNLKGKFTHEKNIKENKS